MKVLEKFIQDCLRNCMRIDNNNNNNKEVWLNQAFGAVQFYIIQNPDSFNEVEKMWITYKRNFEFQIWGLTYDL